MGKIRALALLGVPLLLASAACTALLGDFDVSAGDGSGDGGDQGDGSATGEGGNASCTGTQTFCTDKCVETASDNANCGTCGHACASGFTCSGGNCNSGVVAMVAGGATTCSLLGNGALWCWGANEEGQVGVGDTVTPKPPTFVARDSANNALTMIGALGLGASHACLAKTDGTPFCWGSTTFGQGSRDTSDDGGLSPTPLPTQARQTYLFVGSTPPIFFYSQLSTGSAATHQCGVTNDGGVICWGDNSTDQLGHEDAGFGVDRECTKYGGPSPCAPTPYPAETQAYTAKQVAAGAVHTCMLDSNGEVECWGNGKQGELGQHTVGFFGYHPEPNPVTGFPDSGVSQLSAGSQNTCALAKDGTVWCWGYNSHGEVGHAANLDAGDFCCNIEPGCNYGCYANRDPSQVPGVTGVTALSVGYDHACAVAGDKTVWCWGNNLKGQLGRGTTAVDPLPKQVPGITNAVGVASGNAYSCAWLSDGTAKCWGLNNKGQLGNGNVNSSSPVAVVGLP